MRFLEMVVELIPAAALGNHLWQSTLFAGACGLAALLLKQHKASIRYSIWLAASLKFLFPLSILIGIGAYAGEVTDVRVVPREWLVASSASSASSAVSRQNVAQPPTLGGDLALTGPSEPGLGQGVLIGGWLIGAAIAAIWVSFRRLRLRMRLGKALALNEGRAVEALRRVQSRYGYLNRVRLVSSDVGVEPGVFGIVRPLLLLPTGITDRLTEDQLETIIAHELCHIRRRDNLASVFHVIVQTIFWFHPLVWWIGSRLVAERERSCDEDVVKMGMDRRVYASAILKVCEFYLAVPSAVVSRVTGSNLTTRIEDIMTPHISLEMGSARKFLMACAALAFVTAPVLFGMTTAPGGMSQQAASVTSVPSPRPAVAPTRTAGPAGAVAPQTPSRQAPRPVTPAIAPQPRSVSVATPPAQQESRTDYELRPGDELEIVVWKESELTRRSIVRPDGKIGIPLIGDVVAEGLTPMRLQSEIQDGLSRFLAEPKVTILVSAPRKVKVAIQGAVAHPGDYSLEGRMTVLRLLAQAGGFSEFAKRDQVSIFREEAGAVRRYLFDYGAFLAGNFDQNILLREDDIVIVP